MSRPASLLAFVAWGWMVWAAVRVFRILDAQRYRELGLDHLAALVARDTVADALPMLALGLVAAGVTGWASRHHRGLAALLVALPLLVAFAWFVPDLNDALRPRLGRAPRALLLAAIALVGPAIGLASSGPIGGHLAGVVGWIDRIRARVRAVAGIRHAFHPAGILLPVAFAAGVWGWARATTPDPVKRSVVVMSIDTLRADHLGAYGYERETSPHIDAWASTAAVFESCVSQASWTKPSVASLFTSLYPSVHRTGSGTHERRSVTDGILTMVPATADAPRTTAILSPELVTVAEVFRNAGYRTLGLIANNLIGADDGYGQGFERYENFDDRAIANRAVSWLNEHVDEPVFVYLHFMAPHAPYDPPREYDLFTDGTPHLDIHHTASKDSINFTRTRTLNARDVEVLIDQYDGEVRFADHTVGRVLAALDDSRFRDDTLVMLTADHGEEFMEHGMVWHEPTRFYQALTRVPLIVESPGTAPTRVAETVMSIDIAPTCLEFAGLSVPEAMQGRSFLPFDASHSSRAAFTEGLDWGLGHAVWRGADKLHYDREAPALELYDLAVDPGEHTDLSEVEADRRAVLLDSLEYRWRTNGARRNSMGAVSGVITDDQLERLKSLGYVQ